MTTAPELVTCYCPACGQPVLCRVPADDAEPVLARRTCGCDLTDAFRAAIDRGARKKAGTARFFRRLMA